MKQPMAYGKGKAHQVRKTRAMAAGLQSKTKIYSRMEKWEEENPGTPQYLIKVTLLESWSFCEDSYQPVGELTSTALAMRGIHKTYPVTEEMMFATKKVPTGSLEESWEERLAALVEVKK